MTCRRASITAPWRIMAPVLLASSALTVLAAAPLHAKTQAEVFQFDIPAGSRDQCLRRYIAQTCRQLLYPSALVSERQVRGIKGEMDADRALQLLLAGQPISYRKRGRNVIVLLAAKPPAPSTPSVRRPRETTRAKPAASLPQAPVQADELQELPIVVTGSNIRSSGAGVSPLIELSAEDIERTGSGTIAEALALLPQNFGGTGNEDTSPTGSDRTINNLGLGASVNLRGLGSDATLTLVNGRRVAGSGGRGDFTDLSTIPLGAVEKIEVLPDGASALYGSAPR